MIHIKRFVLLPVILLFLFLGAFSGHAENSDSFSLASLSDFDVFCFAASYTDAVAVLDGTMESSEYGKINEITFQNGLSVTDSGATCHLNESEHIDQEVLSKSKQTVGISCDSQYFYIAVGFASGLAETISPVIHPIYGNCFSVSLDFSLSVSDDNPFLCYGNFRNTYFFSADTNDCVGVFGTRDLITSNTRDLVGRISSQASSSEIAYRAPDGVLWNGAYYLDQAILKQKQDEQFHLVFEARIPVGEVLLTVPITERETLLAALHTKREDVCGQIDIKTSLADVAKLPNGQMDALYLSSSLFGNEACPLSSSGQTWSAIYSDIIDFEDIPSTRSLSRPFTFGSIRTKDPTDFNETLPPNNNLDPSQSSTEDTAQASPPDSDDVGSGLLGQTKTSTTSRHTAETGESETELDLFDSLPTDPQLTPEDTEILYLDSTKSDQKAISDPIGSTVLILCGILLLFSVIVVAMIFRSIEKKEKETKNH